MSVGDLALGLRILSDLLSAGLPVSRALQALRELAPRGWQPMLPHLDQAVREGKSVASSLSTAPVEIPPLVIGIAMAGEAGNGLPDAIRQAADILDSMAATRAAVRAALAYPAMLAVAGAGSIVLMVGVVLPRFATILSDLGQSLPASTRLVLGGAMLARRLMVPAALAAAGAGVALRAWISTDRGRGAWHAVLLRVPVLGSVRFSSASARAATTLAALLRTGVPIRSALVFAARSTGDAEVERRVMAARAHVTTGESLSRAFGQNGALTVATVKLIQAGEESGRLSAMLDHAAKVEQELSDRITRTVLRFLEPALIMIFAAIVGLVAAALLQAVYSVRPS